MGLWSGFVYVISLQWTLDALTSLSEEATLILLVILMSSMVYRRVFWRNKHYMFRWGKKLEFVTEFSPPLTIPRISLKDTPDMVHHEVHRLSLPFPGALVVQNFKIEKDKMKEEESFITVVTWNINKGYRFSHIVKMLRDLNPDVIILQEVDMYCQRSGNQDIGAALAQSLNMRSYAFACEFLEHLSLDRSEMRGGGAGQGGGITGNAIISRYEIDDAWSIRHRWWPFNWNARGLKYKEKRTGNRIAVGARLRTGRKDIPFMTIYSLHLEPFSGPIGRYFQFCEVLQDVKHRKQKGEWTSDEPLVVAGDFGTVTTDKARFMTTYMDMLSRKFICGCRGGCRGLTEAEIWEKYLLAEDRTPEIDQLMKSTCANLYKEWLCNPNPGLKDNFHKRKDWTVVRAWGCFQAKADWLLTNDALVIQETAKGGRQITNHSYLCIKVTAAERESDAEEEEEVTEEQVKEAAEEQVEEQGERVVEGDTGEVDSEGEEAPRSQRKQ